MLILDTSKSVLIKNDMIINLTPIENRILCALANNKCISTPKIANFCGSKSKNTIGNQILLLKRKTNLIIKGYAHNGYILENEISVR